MWMVMLHAWPSCTRAEFSSRHKTVINVSVFIYPKNDFPNQTDE